MSIKTFTKQQIKTEGFEESSGGFWHLIAWGKS
jgi:hypothetical protein